MRKAILAAVAAVALSASYAQATLLYSTDFNAPTYTDGGLIGQNSVGPNSWVITGTSTLNPVNVAGTATNGNVPLTTTGQDVHRVFDTAVSPTDTSIYYSVDINLSAAQTTGDYFMHLSDGGTMNFFGRLFAKSTTGGYVLALGTSSGTTPTYGSTVLSFGTTYQVVARYDVVAGLANDTGALYVNPTSNTEASNTLYVAATTQGTDALAITSFTSVNLRQGTAANAPTLTVDNIRVGTTFADAAAVPEPTALATLGLAGLVCLRRSRKA